jgi:hypothetical protein
MERLSGAVWSPLPSQGRGEGEGLFHDRSPDLQPYLDPCPCREKRRKRPHGDGSRVVNSFEVNLLPVPTDNPSTRARRALIRDRDGRSEGD